MTSGKQNDRARVFFALWPDAAGCAALAAWQPPLRKLCGGKAMRPETLHATLVFLGDVAVRRLEALQLVAQEVAGQPFRLCLDQVHYWGHNHIVCASSSMVPEPLLQLVRRLEQGLRRHRFHFDRRDYRLHLTLLRHAKWSDVPLPAPSALTWQVHDFVLVQSLSDEHGVRYQVLARFPLTAAGPGGLP